MAASLEALARSARARLVDHFWKLTTSTAGGAPHGASRSSSKPSLSTCSAELPVLAPPTSRTTRSTSVGSHEARQSANVPSDVAGRAAVKRRWPREETLCRAMTGQVSFIQSTMRRRKPRPRKATARALRTRPQQDAHCGIRLSVQPPPIALIDEPNASTVTGVRAWSFLKSRR
jgi:hypothetical protein